MQKVQVMLALYLCVSHAAARPLHAVEELELARYLGVWYEIARKPVDTQKRCDQAAKTIYTLNENGQVAIELHCINKEGHQLQQAGEGFIANPPFNSKLKVSYLPEAVRWIPVWRADYWILKIDPAYQTVLVGEPKRQKLWLLSREPKLEHKVAQQYLNYAKTLGYNLDDLIYSQAK